MYSDINLLYLDDQKNKGIGPIFVFIVSIILTAALVFAGIYYYVTTIKSESDKVSSEIIEVQNEITELTLSNQNNQDINELINEVEFLSFYLNNENYNRFSFYNLLLILAENMEESILVESMTMDKVGTVYLEGRTQSYADLALFSNKISMIPIIGASSITQVGLVEDEEDTYYQFSLSILIKRGDD